MSRLHICSAYNSKRLHTCRDICLHTCRDICLHTCRDIYLHTCRDIYLHTCRDIYLHTCRDICLHTCTEIRRDTTPEHDPNLQYTYYKHTPAANVTIYLTKKESSA